MASEDLGIADAIKANFVLFEIGGVIDRELSRKMQSLVGLGNIAIHDYQGMDVDILKNILRTHLKDLEDFCTSILRRFGL